MRLVIQRVSEAYVKVDRLICGSIQQGLLVLLGIHRDDRPQIIPWCVNKLINLRIFSDADGKMNHSIKEIGGQILIVSQFTLYGNCLSGRRPDFLQAAPPDSALPLYHQFIEEVKAQGVEVQTGQFGAEMEVHSINDGPVTLVLDAEKNGV